MSKPLKIIGMVASIAAVIPGPHQPFAAAIAVAANIGSQVLAKPPPARGSLSQMLIIADAPRPYVMGETHFAGVLRHRTGYGGEVDGVENPYLFDVVVYSGVGPVQSITPRIDYGAIPAWYSGFLETDEQLGEMPEADALTATWGTPTGWGAAYKLSGHAAVAWNLKFDKKGKKFAGGIPLTGALVEGVRVYDPRLDDTFPGGVGAHRLDDEATWEYSTNPALHAGSYAYGRFAEGQRVMGIGLPVEGIDFAVIAAWANVCEANDWTVSGVAFEPGDRWANLKDICSAGSGEPLFAGAVLGFRYDAPVVALDTITEADVLDNMGVTFMQSYRDRLNTIVPKYRSADHNWEIVAAETVQVSEYVTEDGEERREEWPFNFVREVDQAAQLAAYKLVNSRELHPIKIHGMPRLRAYRPGDCLHLDLPRLELDIDAVVIERRIDPATMTVELTLVGETEAKHAYALGLTGTAPPTPALGQTPQERDETSGGAGDLPPIEVADEAEMLAIEGPPGQVVVRADTGDTYQHNGGTTGTTADWTLIGITEIDAADILAALLTVDGSGSGLDADLLDGQHGAYYLARANHTGTQSISSVTGTKAQFDTACSDGNFLYVGDVTQYTDELAQDAVGAMVDTTLVYVDGTPLLTRAALTGDVTAAQGSNALTIANDAVTFAKMQDIATLRVLGRTTAGSGNVEELTISGTGSVAMTAGPSFTGTLTAATIAASGFMRINSTTGGLGYATGSGGTVTQITSKATGVAINRATGRITMHNAALAAGASVTFTMTNNAIEANDACDVWHQSAGTWGAYTIRSKVTGATTVDIMVTNNSAGSLSEAIVLGFMNFKGAVA